MVNILFNINTIIIIQILKLAISFQGLAIKGIWLVGHFLEFLNSYGRSTGHKSQP